jgi:hypothetical protein
MDFDDILKILIYIAIPAFLSIRKKARKDSKRAGETGRATRRNLMDKLENMVSEMEKMAGEGFDRKSPRMENNRPAMPEQGLEKKYESGPRQAVDWQDVYTGRETELNRVDLQDLYVSNTSELSRTEDEQRPAVEDKKRPAYQEYGSPCAVDGISFFDADDLVKGIVLSEILQPPLARRQNRRHLL